MHSAFIVAFERYNADMIGTLAFLGAVILGPTAQTATITVPASEDVWVYPHASDPGKDTFLRVWGNGRSIPGQGDDVQNFSFGYLSFDLSRLVAPNSGLKSATLVLFQAPNGTYTAEQAKEFPLEIRKLPKGFTEKSWSYDQIDSMKPVDGKEALWAFQTVPASSSSLGTRVDVDLLRLAPGKIAVETALKSKVLTFALTSGIDPSEGRASYKFFSRDAESKYRPELVLEFAP